MPTMIYSPMIEVRIATASHGIIDVSEDIASGSLSMGENRVSSLNLTLTNHMRKYDGLFTPNDRITVKMKRIKWLQVFSGYLDQVPYFSIFPKDVQLTASCSLKRIKYRLWDRGSQAAYNLMRTAGQGNAGINDVDAGIRDKMVTLLTDVAGWPRANIHIGQIPHDWFTTITRLEGAVAKQTAAMDSQLGTSASSGGASSEAGGTVASVGAPNALCDLPGSSGLVSWFGGPNGGAYANMALSGESGTRPADAWYCAMRWGYQGYVNGKITRRGTKAERQAAMNWLRNRKLIVSNPRNGKAIVVRAADWGPGGVATADNRVIDLSKAALGKLGLGTDAHVNVRWAVDQAIPLGEVKGGVGATVTVSPPAPPVPKGATQSNQDEAATLANEKAQRRAASATAATVTAAKTLAGLPFTPIPDNGGTLQPHAHAAREFIKQNWPAVPNIGGYANSGHTQGSRHYTGHALDIGMGTGGKMPTTEQVMLGNSIARWFADNPGAFGVDQIIWMNQSNSGSGWKLYAGGKYSNNINLGHFNHVHLSFTRGTPPTSVGPLGSGWSNNHPAYAKGFSVGSGLVPEGGVDGGGEDGGNRLLNTYEWGGTTDPRSSVLTGARVLLNDAYLLPDVANLCQVGMRNFMAGPNGDFIAWFPDYFDNYGISGKLHISDVELEEEGFTVSHSDAELITHQFTAAAVSGWQAGSDFGGPMDINSQVRTQGIATVEFPEILQALFNIDPKSPEAQKYLNGKGILNRYGARNDYSPLNTITGPQAEFWYAIKLFTENWAKQFSAEVYTTFMPEAWPGMHIVLDSMRFQGYITGVTHSWDFSGGGFKTRISIAAPSSLEGGLLGLPRAGEVGKQTKSAEPRTKALDNV